ncbi:hypothetical protein TSAR_004159 [Trichomalopsis sarcophagae]|uniref:Uncharacterized protein n=1 Tax=Trichomalopsis sarcophagae TaxID=543379 RepID=A0A232FAW6_9HYME|nr:hypothetical protein TSAR_004159 [Trichomalopsis sarcophagae]
MRMTIVMTNTSTRSRQKPYGPIDPIVRMFLDGCVQQSGLITPTPVSIGCPRLIISVIAVNLFLRGCFSIRNLSTRPIWTTTPKIH